MTRTRASNNASTNNHNNSSAIRGSAASKPWAFHQHVQGVPFHSFAVRFAFVVDHQGPSTAPMIPETQQEIKWQSWTMTLTPRHAPRMAHCLLASGASSGIHLICGQCEISNRPTAQPPWVALPSRMDGIKKDKPNAVIPWDHPKIPTRFCSSWIRKPSDAVHAHMLAACCSSIVGVPLWHGLLSQRTGTFPLSDATHSTCRLLFRQGSETPGSIGCALTIKEKICNEWCLGSSRLAAHAPRLRATAQFLGRSFPC
jgi:hypothetical protein